MSVLGLVSGTVFVFVQVFKSLPTVLCCMFFFLSRTEKT